MKFGQATREFACEAMHDRKMRLPACVFVAEGQRCQASCAELKGHQVDSG